MVDTYIYEERLPLKDDIAKTLLTKPKLLERRKIVPRVLDKVIKFVEKFYDDGGGFGSSRTGYVSEEGYINNAMDSELMVADSGDKYNEGE